MRRYLLLTGLFILGQLATGIFFDLPWGPTKGADSFFYLQAADDFPNITRFQQGYTGYIVLLRIGIFFGSAEWFAVVVQSLLAITAARMLLSLGSQLSRPLAGWVSASIFLLHPPIAQWTRYVLTESFFYASVVTLVWAFLRFTKRRSSWPILFIATMAVVMIRPNGIVALAGLGISLAAVVFGRRQLKFIGGLLSVLLVLLAALTVPSLSAGGGEIEGESFLSRTVRGNITFGDEERSLDMPQASATDDSNIAYVQYVLKHPVSVGRLATTRVAWELAQIRPWYSSFLNSYLAISMACFHLLALYGLLLTWRTRFTLIAGLLSLGWMALIGVTWAIYEGRFGWWFMVLWTVWVGAGFAELTRRSRVILSRGSARTT